MRIYTVQIGTNILTKLEQVPGGTRIPSAGTIS